MRTTNFIFQRKIITSIKFGKVIWRNRGTMNSIDIQRKEECYGCSACRQICPVGAISMQNDEEGFLYPKIDNKSCIECGKCKKICPYYKKERNTNIKFFYAAKAKENSIRENSASGGIFKESGAQRDAGQL